MKYLTNKLIPLVIILLALVAAPFFVPSPVYADATSDICKGLNPTGGGSCTPGAEGKVNNTVKLVINIFSWVVGIAAVIMIIVGGFKYIISSGDSANINSAKNTILYALVGLIIVALAQVIVVFTISKSSGTPSCTPEQIRTGDTASCS